MQFSRQVLPAPLGPIMASTSFFLISRLISVRAFTPPNHNERSLILRIVSFPFMNVIPIWKFYVTIKAILLKVLVGLFTLGFDTPDFLLDPLILVRYLICRKKFLPEHGKLTFINRFP